jgi:hypothetical protein
MFRSRARMLRTLSTASNAFGLVAQWLEQPAHNWLVVGSNPTGATFLNLMTSVLIC